MKQPSDVTDITPGIERSEEDVCIQFPKGWNNDQAKIWLEQHNLKCCEVIPDRPFRWVAWSRPLVCSPVQAPVQDTIKCSCGWKGTRGMLKHTGSLTHADDWWCCPQCAKDVRTMLDEQKKPSGELSCMCGWTGDRNMLTVHPKIHGYRACPKCGSDLTLAFQALRPKN